MMWIMDAVREVLFGRPANREAVLARQLSQLIGEHADAIKNGAEKYTRAKDPFAALMADMYNRDQVERIWMGEGHES